MNCSTTCSLVMSSLLLAGGAAGQAATPASQEYAAQLWAYMHQSPRPYTAWGAAIDPAALAVGPAVKSGSQKHFANALAAGKTGTLPYQSLVVTEHYDAEGKSLKSVVARLRVKEGYDPKRGDWYWAHFLPSGALAESSLDRYPFGKPGYVTMEEDGRLWVFRSGSQELLDYCTHHELAKHVTRIGAGPLGMTLKAPDTETAINFMLSKPGFWTKLDTDERLWVFRQGSKELDEFLTTGDLAKRLTKPGAGPGGITLKAPDAETVTQYIYYKPGFEVAMEDGRLWVFKKDSAEWADFQKAGELAKHVTLPGKGPNGMTLKAPDRETADAYMVTQAGFTTIFEDGRLWVFQSHSPELADYRTHGELAKHITRIGVGPGGLTLKAPDPATIDLYLRSVKR